MDKTDQTALNHAQMRIILATRDVETRDWFKESVSELLAEHGLEKIPPGLAIELYYTGSSSPFLSQSQQPHLIPEKTPAAQSTILSRSSSDPSSCSSTTSASKIEQHFTHRPDLPALVSTEVAASSNALGVFVCGPLSMQNDVANAVAGEQVEVLKGGSDGGGKDVYLHVEHFSWA